MHRCSNELCGKLIGSAKAHIRAEVVGIMAYWCSQACLAEWETHNAIFKRAADPFSPKRHSATSKQYVGCSMPPTRIPPAEPSTDVAQLELDV